MTPESITDDVGLTMIKIYFLSVTAIKKKNEATAVIVKMVRDLTSVQKCCYMSLGIACYCGARRRNWIEP